jgi:DNA repair exonuclease SbcCD nuclease subunit
VNQVDRVLIVGDMHVVPEELEDCSKLASYIVRVADANDLHEIWFSGDQHHTHNVLRLEVLRWWKVVFKKLRAHGLNVVCLVGNHDQASPGSDLHAMMAYEDTPGVLIVDKPTVRLGVLLLPYYHEQEKFLDAVKNATAMNMRHDGWVPPTLFCHQTFDGSTYENGFLASDGFDPNLVTQELVISGHIHTGQEFGKVWYVGAPRWRSLSDANVPRNLWLVEFKDGHFVQRIPFDTGDVCRQIRHLEDTPAKPVQLPLDERHQWRIDVRGPVDWCQARKKELSAAGARVRTFPDQVSTEGRVRESEGIDKAFHGFLGAYQAKFGTPRETLAVMAKERLNV